MLVSVSDRKPDLMKGFTYTHKKPEVKVVYRDRPKTRQPQRKSTYYSSAGSRQNSDRTTRRRKRNSRDSGSRSRSRSRDHDNSERKKLSYGRSAARWSRWRSRIRSVEGSRRSRMLPSFSSTSPLTGRGYSDDWSDTDDEDKWDTERKSIRDSQEYVIVKQKKSKSDFEAWCFGSVDNNDNDNNRYKLES